MSTQQTETGQETAPEPKKPKAAPRKPKMVNVYNAHRFKSIHLGQGRKIPPGCTGKIPYGVFEKIKDYNWVKRAERGDVI
jgi:hypothetical protein